MKKILLLVPLLGVGLVGCNPEAPPAAPAAAEPVTGAALPATPTEPSGDTPAVVIPGAMGACDPAAVAVVKWSFDHLPTPPKLVDVLVGTNDADLKLFVTGPTRSEATTGEWVRPGSIFVLRNHDDGQELSRMTVKGPACG